MDNDPDNDDLTIPDFLRRTADAKPPAEPEPSRPDDHADELHLAVSKHYKRRKMRRLRADLREASAELDKLRMARVGKGLIEKAERRFGRLVFELALADD